MGIFRLRLEAEVFQWLFFVLKRKKNKWTVDLGKKEQPNKFGFEQKTLNLGKNKILAILRVCDLLGMVNSRDPELKGCKT